ncbi:hypothetical protein BDV09DRAFT_166355 [Aspergillus tetrazonus]
MKLIFAFLESQYIALQWVTVRSCSGSSGAALYHACGKRRAFKDCRIPAIIYWQVAHVVPAFKDVWTSMVAAEMGDCLRLFAIVTLLMIYDHTLVRFVEGKWSDELADILSVHEQLRMLFFT